MQNLWKLDAWRMRESKKCCGRLAMDFQLLHVQRLLQKRTSDSAPYIDVEKVTDLLLRSRMNARGGCDAMQLSQYMSGKSKKWSIVTSWETIFADAERYKERCAEVA